MCNLLLQFWVIKKFEHENPDISVRWKELPDLEVEKKLIQEEADLAVNVRGSEYSYVEYLPLYTKKICLLVYEEHPLYQAQEIQFSDLQDEKIILEGEEFQIYRLFQKFCQQENVYPQIIAETSDIGFCQYLAKWKEGLALTIDFVAKEQKLEGIRAIPFANPQFLWEVGLEIPKGAQERREVTLLKKYLQSAFADN